MSLCDIFEYFPLTRPLGFFSLGLQSFIYKEFFLFLKRFGCPSVLRFYLVQMAILTAFLYSFKTVCDIHVRKVCEQLIILLCNFIFALSAAMQRLRRTQDVFHVSAGFLML